MNERLARQIIAEFPYPLSIGFARLRTRECLEPGPSRLDRILDLGEVIVRLLGIVALCECRDFVEQRGASPPPAFTADFADALERPTWGKWMRLAREGFRWLQQQDWPLACPEMGGYLLDENGKATAAQQGLEWFIQLGNNLRHHTVKPVHPSEFKQLCDEGFDRLDPLMIDLEFLLDYRLLYVTSIQVSKRRRQQATFVHTLELMGGNSGEFEARYTPLEEYLVPETIFFGPLEGGRSVNLDPLLRYQVEGGKAPDLFFFNGMKRPESALFVAFKHGGTFTTGEQPATQEIAEELHLLLRYFSNIGEATE